MGAGLLDPRSEGGERSIGSQPLVIPDPSWRCLLGHQCLDPDSTILTDLTVLSSEPLVTAAAVHGAIGSTGASVQARVVLTGIQGACRRERQCRKESDHQAGLSQNPELRPQKALSFSPSPCSPLYTFPVSDC